MLKSFNFKLWKSMNRSIFQKFSTAPPKIGEEILILWIVGGEEIFFLCLYILCAYLKTASSLPFPSLLNDLRLVSHTSIQFPLLVTWWFLACIICRLYGSSFDINLATASTSLAILFSKSGIFEYKSNSMTCSA